MKNIIKSIFLSQSILLGSLSFASDYYVKFNIYEGRQAQIYTEIVKNTGLHKPKADNYHVTLAKVENIDPRDMDSLEAFLKKELRITCQKMINDYNKGTTGENPIQIEVQLSHADRYLVNRIHNHCPVVLYFSPTSSDLLKDINLRLSSKLTNPGKYKSISGKNYTFCSDTVPGTYIPHITVADTNWCDTRATHNRDHIIGKLNDHINAGINQDKIGRDKNNRWKTQFILFAKK